jgi:two-component system sensor histidine kinase DesK
MRLGLLPRDGYSWTGYIWLLYLGTPIWYAVSGRTNGDSGLALTIAATVLFLPLYFRAYWLERRPALVPISLIALIGGALCPINPGGWVFFVYAASFAGRVGPPVTAAPVLGALIAVVAVEARLTGLHVDVWGPAIPLVLLIGGLNVTFVEIGRRQTKLRRAAEAETGRLAAVAERERIGRDLHDLLGHTLSVITLKAELASKLSSRDPDRAFDEIRDVERISREALAEVRRAVHGYGASTLSEELRRAKIALASAGAVLDCDVAAVSLSPVEEHTLALAVREAVTNVIRHAHARRCDVRLDIEADCIRLEVRDDGRGGAAPDGSGLHGMRRRVAELVGGRVERDGRGGTRLVVTVPIGALRVNAPALVVTT